MVGWPLLGGSLWLLKTQEDLGPKTCVAPCPRRSRCLVTISWSLMPRLGSGRAQTEPRGQEEGAGLGGTLRVVFLRRRARHV